LPLLPAGEAVRGEIRTLLTEAGLL
jgi:hypothetical protein